MKCICTELIELATVKYKKFKQDKRTHYDCRDGLPSCDVLSLAVGADGRVWAGTQKGAAYFDGERFVSAGLFDSPVQAAFADLSGNVWLASGSCVCTCDGENMQQLEGDVVAVSQDHAGRLRLITKNYLYRYENGEFVKWYWTENANVLDMCAFADGEIFVAAENSLKTALGKRLRWFNVTPETSKFPDSRIQAVAGDKFGLTWIGTDRGLVIYDAGNHYVTKDKVNALTSYNVRKILFGKSGKRYVGTDIGLVVYDGAKRHFYGAEYWLPDGEVTAIAEADGNSVWVATHKGISHIETVMMTLEEKAEFYQDYNEKYNVRDIGFVAQRVVTDYRDLSSGYVQITDNDGLRLGAYIMAMSYKYGATGDAETLRLARRSFHAMMRLFDITGEPGLMARCIRRKGDTAYCGNPNKKWYDAGEYEWLGDVSSDEVVGHFSGLSVYYDICADETEKQIICKTLCAVVDHILENNYRLRDANGNYTRWGNWNPDDINRNPDWSGEHGTNALEMLSFLKTAYRMSGNEKYNEEYVRLIKEEHYALNAMHCKEKDAHTCHIDDNLCFLISIPLFNYETDPDLRYVYLTGMREHWEYERVERNPFLNVVYAAMTGENADIDKAVTSLKEMPLVYMKMKVLNSLRNDMVWDYSPQEFGEPPQLAEPLPYDEKPVVRYTRNHFLADSTPSKFSLIEGASYLLPYWMGRYYGVIGE